jgi:hypothetical protein
MDRARNAIARTAAQIRTGHWRSAVYFRRTRKRKDDGCWFCERGARITRSHALLHLPNATLAAARVEAWEGRNPGGIRVLLSNPRWESRLLRFLELSGARRRVEGGGRRGQGPRSQDRRLDCVGGGGGGTRPVTSPLPCFLFFTLSL